MLSVTTPVKVCFSGAAAAATITRIVRTRRVKTKGFIDEELVLRFFRTQKLTRTSITAQQDRSAHPRHTTNSDSVAYSPGVMRWAVEVPAFMIHTPPDLLLSGNPSDAVVAPGTAIVMCARACSWSGPIW